MVAVRSSKGVMRRGEWPAVWYGMYGMVWYGMVWYGMVWYGMVWYGMVWYGMVWYRMVWYGMVWYGMVWYVMVCMVWYGMLLLLLLLRHPARAGGRNCQTRSSWAGRKGAVGRRYAGRAGADDDRGGGGGVPRVAPRCGRGRWPVSLAVVGGEGRLGSSSACWLVTAACVVVWPPCPRWCVRARARDV